MPGAADSTARITSINARKISTPSIDAQAEQGSEARYRLIRDDNRSHNLSDVSRGAPHGFYRFLFQGHCYPHDLQIHMLIRSALSPDERDRRTPKSLRA